MAIKNMRYTDEQTKVFETELNKCKNLNLDQPIGFYGDPVPVRESFEIGNKCYKGNRNPRYVHNDLLGYVDAGVVKWALDNDFVRRGPVRYCRYNEQVTKIVYWRWGKNWEDYCNKKQDLDNLEQRRCTARRKSLDIEEF